jgi:TRAP-type mannitol/chloroaromatic compound transport system substrate-binding protein
MNVWKKYSETEQKQFIAACKANVIWSMAVAPAAQGPVLEEFKAKGIKVLRFPDPVLQALRKASAEVLQEEAKSDPIFKEALDSLNAYAKTANAWMELQSLPTK